MLGQIAASFAIASALLMPDVVAGQEGSCACSAGPTVVDHPRDEGRDGLPGVGPFQKLPAEVSYRLTLEPPIAVYPPGGHIPTLIRGDGSMTLEYRRGKEPETLSVRVTGLDLRMLPFSFPMDVDGDGDREALELPALRLGEEFLDPEGSTGTLDLKSGNMDLDFAFAISAKDLPMLEKWGLEEVRFTVEDRGVFDLRTGSFTIHCGVLDLREGPLAGYTIRAGGTGTLDGPARSTVDLKVGVAASPDIRCRDIPEGQNRVTICPGDQILLCWSSSQDVVSVDIAPGVGTDLPPTGEIVVTPPSPGPGDPGEIVYRVTTNGGNDPGLEDTVSVVFYQGQVLGPYQANPDRVNNRWSLNIPLTSLSGRIVVQQVQIVRGTGCLDWSRFFLEHQSPYLPGGIDFGGDVGSPIAVPFRAAGTWYFHTRVDPPRPTPDPRDTQFPVCFQFSGRCQ
ncbi:hypothetical protein AB1L88_25185 [Tautonia sp. JC769]|uniref:hypothetical protein n=1 Tax=Tautonia sp. JC769 TaxID=3232135 RepID=UPI0034592A81